MALIRLPEWGRAEASGLTRSERELLSEAISAWKEANGLPLAPLAFEGPNGNTLAARQYVGVIETDTVAVEIYPKLDKGLSDEEEVSPDQAQSVLNSLLWVLEASGYEELVETGEGGLKESPESFPDLFALLLGQRLRAELERGVPRSYMPQEDDLKAVRGRLLVGRQATQNYERWDRLACAFDEFTPDITLGQILRCACRELQTRVRHPEARRLLTDCLGLLDEVSDITVPEALYKASVLPPWSRAWERFRRPYTLAVRLLRGLSHELRAASADTFVFLLDMNRVFESFVTAAIEARFGVPVQAQKDLGRLLKLGAGGIRQLADSYWVARDGAIWIGDAKYKHLAAGQADALTFAKDETAPAGRFLSPDDIRQLTVYAELTRARIGGAPPTLALFYPFVGTGAFNIDSAEAWNGSRLYIVPVRLSRELGLNHALPENLIEAI